MPCVGRGGSMGTSRTFLRVTMQAESPLIVASGEDDSLLDAEPVRDANGLPMLPATSLAGALRARMTETEAHAWFGWQERDKGDRSSVQLTDGLFHWGKDNKPRDGLILDRSKMESDDLCKNVLPGADMLTREHVRLNERGVVDKDGKFNRMAVPAGARFTFEISTDRREAADRLVDVVQSGLWLGGASRSGYGELSCHTCLREDLELPEDWKRWCEIVGSAFYSDRGLKPVKDKELAPATRTWTAAVKAEGTLLIGGTPRDRDEDRAPWQEVRINWDGDCGSLGSPVRVIPGSSIKGPVRHRTLYHLHKDGVTAAADIVDDLFGKSATTTGGAAGKLRFHDVLVPMNTPEIKQTHVSLDRFTGGARRGALFTDAMLWRPELSIRITELRALSTEQRKALNAALQDLCNGTLGIGSDWGEGVGILIGDLTPPPVTATDMEAAHDVT